MDDRLIPINGLIALLRGDGGWPGLLREQGFERFQLEAPLITPLGSTRIDAVIFRLDPDLVLLCECKGGHNIGKEQARKYQAADAEMLRRTDAVPPRLRRPRRPFEVKPMFVGREEHRAGLEAGLRHLDIEAPLLTVGSERVRLSDASGIRGLDDFDRTHQMGLPPGRLPVDHQSPEEEIQELLLPELIAAQARGEDILAIEAICSAIIPEWAVLSTGAKGAFISRAEQIVRHLAAGEFRGDFSLEPGGSNRRSTVVISSSPAARDPRGRTQSWQARQRRAARALRRAPQQQIEGQMSLGELAEQGGLADD